MRVCEHGPQRILEPLVGLKANQAEVCHTRALITLPLLVCMCACLSIKEIKCANNCIDDASSLVWIFDLSFAALFIQAFAGAIRCPIEELLVRVKRILCGGFCIKFGSSKFHMLANSLIGKNATIVLMKINTSVIFCVCDITRQMILIVGGEPELCWVSERVGSVHAHIHYACASLRCARVVCYIESVKTVCVE